MKIVQILGASLAGGAERFGCALSAEMARRGHDVSVFFLSSRSDSLGAQMRLQLRASGVSIHVGPSEQPHFGAVWLLRQVINEKFPDVVHLHTGNTELAYFLARLLGIAPSSLYRTIHTTNITFEYGAPPILLFINQAKRSFACGSATFAAAKTTIGKRLLKVESGIDCQWPIRTPLSKRESQKRLGLRANVKHFLSIGAMRGDDISTAAKAHDIIVDSWKLSGVGVKFGAQIHFLGDGILRSAIERRAHGDSSIVFHGVRSDAMDWLIAADWLVMPSRFEGLPIVGVEAVCTGTPCIFSDIQPFRDLGDVNAVFVGVDNKKELQAAFWQCVQSTKYAEALSVKAHRERFGIHRTANEYLSVYSNSDTMPFSNQLDSLGLV